MKIRNWWFISFYLLLSLFIIYELAFLVALLRNTDLKDLYNTGFTIIDPSPSFKPSESASFYYLPIIGLVMSSVALISSIFTGRIFIDKSPRFKFFFLVLNFIIFAAGFLISFSGQLFYAEWSNNNAIIQPNGVGKSYEASFYYQNWVSSQVVWSIFGMFFALLVAAVILLLKLNLINVQTYHFYRQREADVNFEPELKQPLPSSNEFDPNDTQTITIFLDDDKNENLKTKKKSKKVAKVENKKVAKKKLNARKKTNKVNKSKNKKIVK